MSTHILRNDPYSLQEQEKRFKEEFKELSEADFTDLCYFIHKIMLLKIITQDDQLKSNRFLQGMIYDALFALKELKNNERYFYFNIRSLIENLMRFVVRLPNDSSLGVTRLEKSFREYSLVHHERLSLIYGESCNFVHNNQASGLDLEINYQEVKSLVHIEGGKQQNCIKLLKDIADVIAESLVKHFTQNITNAFPMNIADLYYLLGNEYSKSLKHLLEQ